jgi:transposase
MLNVTGGLKVYLAVEPADMRKGFGGLYALASEKMREDPRQGALFAFTNRDRNRVKLLHFDGTGLWVCVKRLEKGTFSWPAGVDVENGKLRLGAEALALLLDGVDLKGAKMRPWYQRE